MEILLMHHFEIEYTFPHLIWCFVASAAENNVKD
jgi:hypothetical protein